MNEDTHVTGAVDWSTERGDSWARLWRQTDRGLAGLSPHLVSAVLGAAPAGPFRAFEVGCGAGTTTISVAHERPDASIIACDISPALVQVAQQRAVSNGSIEVRLGDAEMVASREGPFDLIFSRHGVMFFEDPVRAFRGLRDASTAGAGLVFSCFQDWASNPWASGLASTAAGQALPPPGREPGGFAFSDPGYVRDILGASGWITAEPRSTPFPYVPGEGAQAVDEALSFLAEIGPAAVVLKSMSEQDREGALQRMRATIEEHFDGARVQFPAAAWIWTAKAG